MSATIGIAIGSAGSMLLIVLAVLALCAHRRKNGRHTHPATTTTTSQHYPSLAVGTGFDEIGCAASASPEGGVGMATIAMSPVGDPPPLPTSPPSHPSLAASPRVVKVPGGTNGCTTPPHTVDSPASPAQPVAAGATLSPTTDSAATSGDGAPLPAPSSEEWPSAAIAALEGPLDGEAPVAIYRARRTDGQVLLAKQLCFLVPSQRDAGVALLRREFRLCRERLRHPCILELQGYIVEKPSHCLVLMEPSPLGSVRDVLDAAPDRIVAQEGPQLRIALHVASAMAFLHSQRDPEPVLHRDLKSSNVRAPAKP